MTSSPDSASPAAASSRNSSMQRLNKICLLVLAVTLQLACAHERSSSGGNINKSGHTANADARRSDNSSGRRATVDETDIGEESALEEEKGQVDAKQSEVTDGDELYHHGKPCTIDCSGHEAGYQWAERKGITDDDDCGGKSRSFIEGCQSYVEENYGGSPSENPEDDENE
jgi:hypothetical protein